MRQIKFRTWIKQPDGSGHFEYWGFGVHNAVYTNPPQVPNGEEGDYLLEHTQQCTDLIGVNGVEIYEGDIISNPDMMFGTNSSMLVKYENGCFRAGPNMYLHLFKTPIVTGNLYDTPGQLNMLYQNWGYPKRA
jgi:hypothetical protein